MTDWHPFPKQEKALILASQVDELLYGGARGPGKTEAGIVWKIEPDYIKNELYRGLAIRRNFDDLKDWIDRGDRMYKRLSAKKAGNPPEFRFPSGAKIRTGHLKDKDAYTKYQGHEYQKILIEELTQIPSEDDYEKVIASCRSTIDGLKACVFATTNPDGPGHEWVKDRFHCEDTSMKIYEYPDEETGIIRKRVFVPATIDDNPILMKKDPGYIAMLNAISDPILRKQWRFGDWSDFDIEGAFYTQHLRTATQEGRIGNVPYDPMKPVNVTFDLGTREMTCWFFQIIGYEIHFINYKQYSDMGYKDLMVEFQKLNYVFDKFYFPHDINQREQTTAIVRLETAKAVGMRPYRVAPRPSAISDGIQAVENLFGFFWFDKVNCKDGLWGLKNYKKEWDAEKKVWKREPIKDWAKHRADSVQTMALVFKFDRQGKHSIYRNRRQRKTGPAGY